MVNYNVTIASAVSLTASFNTTPKDISDVFCYAVQGNYTLTSASSETVIIQGSLSPDDAIWDTVSTFTLSGSSGHFLLNVECAGYTSVRASYTKVAATAGAITIKLSGKGVNVY